MIIVKYCMKKLDYALLPKPAGLYNTGSICYFNSLLQVLASCTSLKDWKPKDPNNILGNIFMKCMTRDKFNPIDSSELLSVLHSYIPQFGNGQESASEALSLMINTIDDNDLNNLLIHRFKYVIKCLTCSHTSEQLKDHSMFFEMFHTLDVTVPNMLNHKSILADYKCNKCNNIGAIRISNLTMLPEIILILFNVYYKKQKHMFPNTLEFPGIDDKKIIYNVVGQVEHYGSLNGGHYTSKALRYDGTYLFNDNVFHDTVIEPSESTYIVVYHYISNK